MKSISTRLCDGRGPNQTPVLDQPIEVRIAMTENGDGRTITLAPEGCNYSAGLDGERCKASHRNGPRKVAVGNLPYCCYCRTLPDDYPRKSSPSEHKG